MRRRELGRRAFSVSIVVQWNEDVVIMVLVRPWKPGYVELGLT